MNVLLVLPIVIPLLTAASMLLIRTRRLQRRLSIAGAGALFLAALALLSHVLTHGTVATSIGSWPAPFGIILVADTFAGLMVVITGLKALAVSIYAVVALDEDAERAGYHPVYQTLLMGISGAFLTGDFFNLFVWFEVMLLSSFVLISLGNTRQQVSGAVKYVTINLVSSAILLIGLGILYGKLGTLNMADVAVRLAAEQRAIPRGLESVLAMLFIVSFGIKAGVFPLNFWLPASYHTPSFPVSAIFAGLLTKVGVYALIRSFTLVFVQDIETTHSLLLAIAVATMVTGVLGAASKMEIRRILSFHIISQIGYMVLGLALFTPFALAAAVFYVVHHIIVKTNLFLIAGFIHRLQGSNELHQLGGLYRSKPLLAALFLIPALSLAGVPPLSGFFAKLALIQAGLQVEAWLAVAVALAVGLLTLFSMLKIWNEAFWKDTPEAVTVASLTRTESMYWLLPIGCLALLTIAVGIFSGPLFEIALRAGQELMQPDTYLQAVREAR
ncbi:MAG: Na+/H+ antiporter subunit D [Planctomycetota bacterium]